MSGRSLRVLPSPFYEGWEAALPRASPDPPAARASLRKGREEAALGAGPAHGAGLHRHGRGWRPRGHFVSRSFPSAATSWPRLSPPLPAQPVQAQGTAPTGRKGGREAGAYARPARACPVGVRRVVRAEVGLAVSSARAPRPGLGHRYRGPRAAPAPRAVCGAAGRHGGVRCPLRRAAGSWAAVSAVEEGSLGLRAAGTAGGQSPCPRLWDSGALPGLAFLCQTCSYPAPAFPPSANPPESLL